MFREKMERYRANREQKSVQALLGLARLSEHGVWRTDGEMLVVFLLEPDNLSVLSEAGVAQKVYGLMTVLKGLAELEVCCVNSRENFRENKRYLKKRLLEEKNPKVQALLGADLEFLETMERQDSGAREFLLLFRFKEEEARELAHLLNRVEKAFREQAIRVRRAEIEDLRRILSVYFTQTFQEECYEDFDGERWVGFEEERKALEWGAK